jgi:V/A-type H+-transporting ATPase subunit B
MKLGIGAGKTREDHKQVSDQMYALYAEGRDLSSLSDVVGKEALSPDDNKYLDFADRFEREFISQGRYEDRCIERTLDIGWGIMSDIPESKLKRIKPETLKKYRRSG